MSDYYNSGFPLYDGIKFNNAIELLTIIRDSLEASGWNTIADNIATTQTLLTQGITDNGHLCDIKFVVDSNSANYLGIKGVLEGIESSPLTLEFTPDEVNKLWLTADRDSGCLCIRNQYLYSGAINFGFLERWDTEDEFAWMVAKLNNKLNDAYVAKSKHDGVIWKQVGSDYNQADNSLSPDNNGAYQGIFDLVAIAHPYISFTNTNLRNAGYSAQLGATGKPIITRRFYLEGRGSINNYPGELYNRGFVKHVANGFGSIPQGKIEQDNLGVEILSTGGDGWQGLVLSEAQNSIQPEPETIFRKGINFTLGLGAIAEIRNVLLNLGWESILESETELTIKSVKGCCVNFVLDDLVLVHIEVGANSSPTLSLPYTELTTNQIWLTANEEAIALTIKNGGDNSYQGIWAGNLQDSDNQGLGYIRDDLSTTYIYKNNVWRVLGSNYTYTFDNFGSFPTTTSDRLTVAATPIRYYDFESDQNSAYKAYEGSLNGATNDPLLDFYCLIAGKSSAIAYGLSDGEGNSPELDYLGVVQFLCVGMASLNGGEVITLPSGVQYLSSGGKQWQGMRIG